MKRIALCAVTLWLTAVGRDLPPSGTVRCFTDSLAPGSLGVLSPVQWESGDHFHQDWDSETIIINGAAFTINAVLSPDRLLVFGTPTSGIFEVIRAPHSLRH